MRRQKVAVLAALGVVLGATAALAQAAIPTPVGDTFLGSAGGPLLGTGAVGLLFYVVLFRVIPDLTASHERQMQMVSDKFSEAVRGVGSRMEKLETLEDGRHQREGAQLDYIKAGLLEVAIAYDENTPAARNVNRALRGERITGREG